LRQGADGVVTAVTSAAYVALPVTFVSVFAQHDVASYALADRLWKGFLILPSPILLFLKGWVPSPDMAIVAARSKRAIRAVGAMAAVLCAVFVLTSSVAAFVLGAGKVRIDLALAVPLGFALAVVTISQCTGLVCLQALGMARYTAISTVVGAVVGIPALAGLAAAGGGVGAAWAVVLSEAAVLGSQLLPIRAQLRENARAVDATRSHPAAPVAWTVVDASSSRRQ
jgi:hypothetical protein